MKKRLILGLVGVIALFFVYWASSVSRITITVNNPSGSQPVNITITNEKSGKSTEFTASSSTASHSSKKGAFNVLVSQGETSYFEAMKTHGFFGNTKISATLVPEKSRQFVGNNPGSCMNYLDNVLVSYACTDYFQNIKTHVPATASTPTYVKNNSGTTVLGYTEGIVSTGAGNFVLLHTPQSVDTAASHQLYRVDGNLALSNKLTLPDLNPAVSYSITPYKDGFVVYDAQLDNVLYYSSLGSKPEVISIEGPKNNKLTSAKLAVSGDTMTVLYSAPADAKSGNGSTEVVLVSGVGQPLHFSFGKTFTSAIYCGQQMLCAVDSDGMEVYDISREKPVSQYVVSGVFKVLVAKNSVLGVTKSNVLDLDIAKSVGYVSYSFGEYKYDNISTAKGGYVLSLVNNQGKKVVLYINPAADNTDSIDKKVSELQKHPEITDISAYGKYIYISPDLGGLVYVPSLRGYGYDPVKRAAVDKIIRDAVSQSGIDQKQYSVINTLR